MAHYEIRTPIGVRCAVIVLGLMTLVACSSHNLDQRGLHPLQIERRIAKLPLEFAADGSHLDSADASAIADFSVAYVERGHGPLVINAARGEHGIDDATLARIRTVEERVLESGLRSDEVVVRFWPASEDQQVPVVLSYEHVTVLTPECDNWDRAPSFNPSNTVHDNYGCATQRYLGLMVADPADLVVARGKSGRNATRSSLIIQNYRAGVVTAAETPDTAPAALSEVGQ